MNTLAQIRAELAALHQMLQEGHPDRFGIEQGISDWMLAEAKILLDEAGMFPK